MADISPLQQARAAYRPKLPAVLARKGPLVLCQEGEPTQSAGEPEAIRARFPKTYGHPLIAFVLDRRRVRPTPAPVNVGVILSGGQAPGGHNVVAGLFDGLVAVNPASRLYGFLGGTKGLTQNKHRLLTKDIIDEYRNTGGFDIIGSGRDKLEKQEDFEKAAATCKTLGVSALVIIGGDDSNTNACMLAEYMEQEGLGIKVIGCPKTIDGDLKNDQIEVSFGFDTATKVYGELIGNIARDALSAKKYWHFIKLMGRTASHITLECALQTHANIALVSEEVAARNLPLRQVIEDIVTIIKGRAEVGMNFGVVLVPEGLVEFIPDIKGLIVELNRLLAENDTAFRALSGDEAKRQFALTRLSTEAAETLRALPVAIQMQLLLDRDSHGNVQVSRIETEKLLIDMVAERLKGWKPAGSEKYSFSAQSHFLGYEGRCAAPSNFDADYGYSLGYTAAALIAAGKTGYMASVRNLTAPRSQWIPGGVPLTMMMNMERRGTKDLPVIRKALVDLAGKPFAAFAAKRDAWARHNHCTFPGPIQYFGPEEVCDRPPLTLELERG